MRRAPILLALVLLAAGCGTQRPRLVDVPPPTKTTFAGSRLTPPRPAPPVSLKDASGRRYTLSKRHNHYVLVTFLYTHCPDVCPLIASSLNTVLRTIGPKANVEVVAISVDPKGDTARSVRAYAKRMHLLPAFHYLIGSRSDLQPVWAAWSVKSVDKTPNLVEHVAYTALIDGQGNERLIYDTQVSAQDVLHDLRLLKGRRAGRS